MNKIAIVALTRGYNHRVFYNTLIERNKSILKSLSDYHGKEYDFILIHEGNISTEDMKYISDATPSLDIKFWDLYNTLPKTAFDKNKIVTNELCPPNHLSQGFHLGYRHMCHFWSIDFLEYLKDYDYVIRIDEDCIVERFKISIIDIMEKQNLHFISPMFQGQDEPFVIDGLEKLRLQYIEEEGITEYTKFEDIKCPYTNFMIVNVKEINNNKNVMKFLKMVDDCGCIYSNRWGDLPIWGVVLDTIMDQENYKEIKSIRYYHKSHNTSVN
jgi:hypothetical protein